MADQNEGEDGVERIWREQSIYRLPSFIKHRNENIYEPILVSIGPYHHGEEHLIPMEVHKRRAKSHFIMRSRLPFEEYMYAFREVEHGLRQSYDQLHDNWRDSNDFLQMMIIDGCFILEYMAVISGSPRDYDENDPIFSYYGSIINYNYLMRDMLLIENQLPYLVLEKLLFVAQSGDVSSQNTPEILSRMMTLAPNMGRRRHMLDMYMEGLLQGVQNSDDQIKYYNATQLYRAGIRFKKIEKFNEINFDKKKGILNLPSININDYTISSFMNLKAFELRGTTCRDFNSYIRLMETLVETIKDVKLLQSQGIINVNFYGSEENVVKLFKELAKDTVIDKKCKSSSAALEMNEYYVTNMEQCKNIFKMQVVEWISYLGENYFKNPWTVISVVAAACYMILTVIQTIYNIRQYYSS